MSDFTVKRIKRDYRDIKVNRNSSAIPIDIELVNDNWTELEGYIIGPEDTPYEGGRFVLDIKLPGTFPFNAPIITFKQNIWHPNVSREGKICVDILDNGWTSTYTLRFILLSIRELLAYPELTDTQNCVCTLQYKHKYPIFDMTARFWTAKYANGPYKVPHCDLKLRELMSYNMHQDCAMRILSGADWDMKVIKAHFFPQCDDDSDE
ncbi:ubiquitin-conjugating enzyme E2-22 kDa-like [Teleopsis dalmanni]|uniref:ubiquitin-conjugating enzyme E2-22 kDa-like n=1 Tax=Teleopsis dalmanni TaxID=139649 RepID=UPI0018CDFD27|nr:ubiquitin-conjugating enzyme E2-22 kDa-like [Teleopsis dalmanni]XP_037941959.1 ubiquitin-conjugating enzyme E2-22 kDa-like [Teleopsis dalmanni]